MTARLSAAVLSRGSGIGAVSEMRKEINFLRGDITDLTKQEIVLDGYISQMQDMLRDLQTRPDNAELAYVTHDDIRNLPSFDGETLIAIKAPSGTGLEVPDPDDVSYNCGYNSVLTCCGHLFLSHFRVSCDSGYGLSKPAVSDLSPQQ